MGKNLILLFLLFSYFSLETTDWYLLAADKEIEKGQSLAEIFATLNTEEEILAPDFKLQDLSEDTIELSSFRDKNAVLLFFWTTWCPYCLREMKRLDNNLKELREKGIELIAINAGEPAFKVNRVVKNYDLAFCVLLDRDSEVTEAYGIIGVPSFVLVDKKGYIRFRGNYFPDKEAERLSLE